MQSYSTPGLGVPVIVVFFFSCAPSHWAASLHLPLSMLVLFHHIGAPHGDNPQSPSLIQTQSYLCDEGWWAPKQSLVTLVLVL